MRDLSQITIEEANQVFGWLGDIVNITDTHIQYKAFDLYAPLGQSFSGKEIAFEQLESELRDSEIKRLASMGIEVDATKIETNGV